MRFRGTLLQGLVTAVLLLFLLTHRQSEVQAQTGAALEILQLVNQFRVNNGLTPFTPNSALVSAAQNQANYMAEFSVFSSHVGYGGSTPQSRANAAGYSGFVIENIVGGTGLTASKGLTWWINSPIHYNTLVTSRYSEAGTAFASNGESNFFVLVVGRKSNAPASGANDVSPEPLYITPITLTEPGEDGSIVHVVQDGQAIWSLAAHYEVPISDILLFNNMTESDFVQPGDEIVIRLAEGQEPPPTPTPPLTHLVRDGQSLWSIALRYNLKFADLLLFNGFDETTILQPGDEVVIRLAPGQAPPPTPTPILFHSVQAGQTLWDIALANGMNLDELLSMNEGLSAESVLQPGDEIRVRLPAPTAVPTITSTTVSTNTPSPPTQTPLATPTALQVAIADVEEATPFPVERIPIEVDEDNGRVPLTSILYVAAGLMAIIGVGFLLWAREE